MAKTGRKSVNIQMASSAKGLKEELEAIARRRAISVSKVAAQIYQYAVNNPGSFPNELKNPLPKPGKHISSDVPVRVADELMQWAKNEGRSRSHHCCFLLECVISDEKLKKQIFS